MIGWAGHVSNLVTAQLAVGRRRTPGSPQPDQGGKMNQADELPRENAALRERLSRLSEASLRINESLDLDTVLQGILDSPNPPPNW